MVTSKLTEQPVVTSKQYPYMGKMYDISIHTTLVVLFTSRKTGTIVYSSNPHKTNIGEYSDKWNETMFEPFVGVVTLEEFSSSNGNICTAYDTKETYFLTLHENEVSIIDVGVDVEALKQSANKKEGFELIWEEDGIYWCGRTQDQCDDYYYIAPLGTALFPVRTEQN